MYKICFYVPESHLEPVKLALFKKGAGQIGTYDCCAWQTLGEGQFRPLLGSDPFIGALNKIEKVPEYRVEIVCRDDLIREVIEELKRAHPYEQPAIDVWRLDDALSSI